MQKTDNIRWLEEWNIGYSSKNGSNNERIIISTLANPGWSLKINLKGTPMEGVALNLQSRERTENDWIFFRVTEGFFLADGGPGNLNEILSNFRSWIETGIF